MTMNDTATAPVDQYDAWRRRLAGEQVEFKDGEFQAGFYRSNRKDGTSEACAIWFKDGIVKCKLGGRMVDPDNVYNVSESAYKTLLGELWTFVCLNPVSHDDYKLKMETGLWPGENAVVTRSNLAPDDNSREGIQAQIEELYREAERLMKLGAAKTKMQADEAADVADKLGKLWTKAENARKVEKQPHLDACSAVDDSWRPLTNAASIYKRLKDTVVEPFLKAQKAAKEKAEREAREKADAARREAERVVAEQQARADEAARKGDVKAVEAAQAKVEEANASAISAQAHADVIAATPITAGTRGRKTSLRSETIVTITDRDAVLAFFKDRQEVTDLLQTLAEKMVKAGATVPGVSVGKDQNAA